MLTISVILTRIATRTGNFALRERGIYSFLIAFFNKLIAFINPCAYTKVRRNVCYALLCTHNTHPHNVHFTSARTQYPFALTAKPCCVCTTSLYIHCKTRSRVHHTTVHNAWCNVVGFRGFYPRKSARMQTANGSRGFQPRDINARLETAPPDECAVANRATHSRNSQKFALIHNS